MLATRVHLSAETKNSRVLGAHFTNPSLQSGRAALRGREEEEEEEERAAERSQLWPRLHVICSRVADWRIARV